MESKTDLANPQPPVDESILKPKPTRKTPNFTPEHRQALAERMRKVNADRIAKSKSAENAKVREQKALEKDAKRKELEAEIERLKLEASQAPKFVAPIPKKTRQPKPRQDDHEPNYDELIAKARERPAPAPAPSPAQESDDDTEPEPTPVKARKPRAQKAPEPAPIYQPPKFIVKFL
jgi:hypothetical protein